MKKELNVDGVKVTYIPKRVKNINMRLKKPDGEIVVSAPVWMNTKTVEAFVREKIPWIMKRKKALAEAPAITKYEPNTEELKQWRVRVEEATRRFVAYWEPIMGVKVQSLAFRNMTSRWGSCNPKTGRVCINIQLVKYPESCLEYVVVHELCHFLERKHNAHFWELVTQYLPDWKASRALLR